MPRCSSPVPRRALRTSLLLVGLAALLPLDRPARAGDPPREAVVVLKAARLFDGVNDRFQAPGVVVVVGGKIAGVGPSAKPPAGAQIIDLGDATLLPGFIDSHVHLSRDESDDPAIRLRASVPELALRAAQYGRRTLMSGFTTVRDLGADEQIAIGLAAAIARGDVEGPQIIAAGEPIGATGGASDEAARYRPSLFARPSPATADGADGLRTAVRLQARLGARVIKLYATGPVFADTASVDRPELTRAELEAAIDEAHRLGLKVAAHAHGNTGARSAVLAGVDSIEHGTFVDDATLEDMARRRTWLVPTLLSGVHLRGMQGPLAARAAEIVRRQTELLRRAKAKGVRVAFGSDSSITPHGENAREFALMAAAGMTPIEALRAATSSAASLLGVGDEVGTLVSGRWADIVAVPGDPRADLTVTERVTFVMQRGHVVRGATPAATGRN